MMAKLVDKSGTVIAFEPESANYALLSKSILFNNLTNIKAYQEAVLDKDDLTKLYLHGANPGDTQLFGIQITKKFSSRAGLLIASSRME